MKILLILYLSMNIMTSCKQEPNAPEEQKDLPEQTFRDIPYGKDSLQKMDVYLPANRTAATTKSLVLIHGGGWTSGSKSEFAPYIDSFRNRLPGYAIFNINYRLANSGHHFPTQENDVKAALEFITGKADDYQVSPDNFSLFGFSAGAHLALLQAYKCSTPRIKAVVDYFGPTDLMAMYQRPWHPMVPFALQVITGTTPEKNKAIYEESSPANYVSESSPPTLILHGGKDLVVDVSQSKLLAEKLAKHGVKHELHIYPSEKHGRWYGPSLVSSFDRIEKFLKTHSN